MFGALWPQVHTSLGELTPGVFLPCPLVPCLRHRVLRSRLSDTDIATWFILSSVCMTYTFSLSFLTSVFRQQIIGLYSANALVSSVLIGMLRPSPLNLITDNGWVTI